MKKKALPECKDALRAWDAAHQPLDDLHAQRIKDTLLKQAMQEPSLPPKPFIPRSRLIWLCAALIPAFGLFYWFQPGSSSNPEPEITPLQTAHKDPNPFQTLHSNHVRELQFTTPTGTRIIWQFQAKNAGDSRPLQKE